MIGQPDGLTLEAVVIELRGVHKDFTIGKRSITALRGISAKIGAGRITGLVGPDGAGKTTLMRLLGGLLKPDSGSIRVLGFDTVTEAQKVQENIGYMPQRFGLYEDLSVAENLALYADIHGLRGPERKARLDHLASFAGLGPFQKRLAGRLSGGMKQKLGLACTLVRPPRLLLLDEPSVGVDPLSRRELWEIVHSLIAEGISILWATAYLDEAERCHDVLLLNEGKLLATGPPEDFKGQVKGRTFVIRVDGARKRATLRQVLDFPHVIDAIIKGRDIRVLLSNHIDAVERFQTYCDQYLENTEIRKVPPIFEDAFISLLKIDSSEWETQTEDNVGEIPRSSINEQTDNQSENKLSGPMAVSNTEGLATEPIIVVDNLVKKYGDFAAVDGVNFEVNRGEIFGLLGPNGAGKSTIFKMLCGLLPPTDGAAVVLDIDLRRAAAVARGKIGYMAQKFSLYGNMTVLQNLQFFASAYGLTGAKRNQRIKHELSDLRLDIYADTDSETLPLGFKQRLALASAIMHSPGVLFLDEPTSGVDPLVRREFWTRINNMAAAGVTVLVTTHFMEEAEYCDRIGIIYRGRLVALGTPEDLRDAHSSSEMPNPSLEDTFVDLIERYEQEHSQ